MTDMAVYAGPTAEDLAQIPEALKALRQWVLWRGQDKVDDKTGAIKLNKIPVDPQTLHNASSTDPATWGTFAQCVAALPTALEEWEDEDPSAYRGGGIGFVFHPDDPYAGIDFDHCRDPDTGALDAWAQDELDSLDSYTEVSPSGTGVHCLVQSTLPPTGRKKGDIEMYSEERYFTMTGWHVVGTPRTIEPRQAQVTALHASVFGHPERPQAHTTTVHIHLEDAAILAKAHAAKNGGKFTRLWEGDISGHGNDDSRADLALCQQLAFWTRDPAQLDRLFRQSGLMRDKWESRRGEQTYGAMTITAALAKQREQYRPPVATPSNGHAPGPEPLDTALVSSVDLLEVTLAPKASYTDWLTERALVMVYGPRGVGKTLWMLELGISLSMPRPFLKWPVHHQGRVLFVDGEMSLEALQQRLRQLAGDHPPPGLHFLPSELVYARAGRDLTLTAAADRHAIDTMLDAHHLTVLILDNVSCLFPGLDESRKQDWEPINAWLIRLRHRGITVIVGHHAGKNGQQRGTSGREDALDTIIALTLPPGHQAQDGCHVHLRFDKSRGVKGPTVEPLDVRLEDTPHGAAWTYALLDARRKERIKAMLEDGMPAKLIADELGLSPSYVYRCKREFGF